MARDSVIFEYRVQTQTFAINLQSEPGKAMKNLYQACLVMLLSMAAVIVHASQPPLILETDWLRSAVGSSGSTLGAEVINIDEKSDMTIIDVEIPLDDPARFDRIEVIDKKSQKPLKTVIEPNWIDTLDKDTHGLRLYLKKPAGFEFRLRLIDAEQ